MTTFTSEDRENAKLVEEAPYHPGYEDAVVYPTVIVDSGASVQDKEDVEQMLREQLHAQQSEINALRKALMYANNTDVNKIKADAIRWLAQEHWHECREDRPVQYWMRVWADKIEKGSIK